MKAAELRERTNEELKSQKADEEDKIFRARVKNAVHQLDDSSSISKSKKEVARINTILKERSDSAAKKEEA